MSAFDRWLSDNAPLLMELRRERERESGREITDGDLTLTKDALRDAYAAGFRRAVALVEDDGER